MPSFIGSRFGGFLFRGSAIKPSAPDNRSVGKPSWPVPSRWKGAADKLMVAVPLVAAVAGLYPGRATAELACVLNRADYTVRMRLEYSDGSKSGWSGYFPLGAHNCKPLHVPVKGTYTVEIDAYWGKHKHCQPRNVPWSPGSFGNIVYVAHGTTLHPECDLLH
jgi:hypothetical protein